MAVNLYDMDAIYDALLDCLEICQITVSGFLLEGQFISSF